MEITLQLSSLISLLGITTALVFSLLLYFFHWGNQSANRCLSLMLVAYSLLALCMVLISENPQSSLHVYHLLSLQFTLGPLIYFYTRLLTKKDFSWKRQHLWHLLPMISSLFIWQLQSSLLTINGVNYVDCNWASEQCSVLYQGRFIYRLATYISLFVYLSISLSILRSYLRHIKNSCSAIEEINLNWLKILIGALLFYTALASIREVYGSLTVALPIYYPIPLFFSIFLALFGILQRKIPQEDLTQQKQNLPLGNEKKYETSSLTQEGAKLIWGALQQYMKLQKPYLQPGLKIANLASQMEVSTSHLSETINSQTKQSFYEYINIYRVVEAKRLMMDKSLDYCSITDIGYKCGFNSNSTFFTYFKKYQQQTPRQYRQRSKTGHSTDFDENLLDNLYSEQSL